MLRLFFIGLLLFGLGSGLRDGWLIVKWSQLFHQVGFTSVDPEKPLNLQKLLFDDSEKNK